MNDTLPTLTRRLMLGSVLTAAATPLWSVEARPNNHAGKLMSARENPVLGCRAPLHHIGLRTREFDRSLEMYQKGLGFVAKIKTNFTAGSVNRSVFLNSGVGSYVELFEDIHFVPALSADVPAADGTAATGWTRVAAGKDAIFHFALPTTRIDGACKSACAAGARLLVPPYTSPFPTGEGDERVEIKSCFLEGPSGELIELLQGMPW